MENINCKKISDKLVSFIKSSFKKAGFKTAVVAVSGGVDSATSLTLVTRALEPEHVYPYFFPYGQAQKEGVEHAQLVCDALHIPIQHATNINIQPIVEKIIQTDPTMDHVRKGNIMARTRMILLFDGAKKRRALVVGTENKTEHYLGYFTRFGDEASDIEPLRSLFKTQVYELAEFLNVPPAIVHKAPSAGLWDGQTDEVEFGFSYKDADEILKLVFEEHVPEPELEKRGFEAKTIQAVVNRVRANAFKHLVPFVSS